MGLDQYLHEKVSLNAYEYAKEMHPEEYARAKQVIDLSQIKTTEDSSVEVKVTVAYWRKANQIHRWFTENTMAREPDMSYYVERDDLIKLRKVCKKVLDRSMVSAGKVSAGQQMKDGEWEDILRDGDVITNPEVAEALLPTTSGFFFGSTDYDEWYLKQVRYTADKLTIVLFNQEMWTPDHKPDVSYPATEFEYHASW